MDIHKNNEISLSNLQAYKIGFKCNSPILKFYLDNIFYRDLSLIKKIVFHTIAITIIPESIDLCSTNT